MWRWLRSLFAPGPSRPELVHAPPDEFARSEPPAWLLEWKGSCLPGPGGGYQGRLSLWEEPLRAIAEVSYPLSHTRPAQPQRRKVEFSDPAARRLWSVLREAFPDRLLSIPEECYDGLPFEVVVHRREPYLGVRARCNLGDAFFLIQPPERLADHPMSELMESERRAERPLAAIFQLGFLLQELSTFDEQQRGQGGWEERKGEQGQRPA
jgi:hypothetical protein